MNPSDIVLQYTSADMQQVQFGAFMAGIVVTLVIGVALWAVYKMWTEKPEVVKKAISTPVKKVGVDKIATLVLVGLLLLHSVAISYAQTNTPTPVPTATPFPTLDIPINTLMNSTNGWLATFAPIAAIGIGISIALAVLGYLGKMIKSAFT